MKKFLKYLIIYIIIFLLLMLTNHITFDSIWNYGFAHSMYKGLIPYKDFNMVITPLYPFLCSIFLKIIGSSFLAFELFNSLILLFIVYLLEKRNCIYIIPLMLIVKIQNYYSILTLLFLLLIIKLDEEKRNDYLIGFMLGLCILTKQHVGICVSIASLFKCKKNQVIKRLIGLLVPVLITIIYFVFNNTLYEFFDYTIFGLFDFASKNTSKPDVMSIMVFSLDCIILLYSLIKLIKCRFNDKELLYSASFISLSVPLFDFSHFVLAIIPFLVYILKNKLKILYNCQVSVLVLCFVLMLFDLKFNLCNEGLFKYYNFYNVDIELYKNYANDYKLYSKDNRVFYLGEAAYFIKLLNDDPIDKFDLINNGNMGYKGQYKYIKEIDEICSKEDCFFLLSYDEHGQTNKEIIEHILNNYKDHYKIFSRY